MNTYCWYNTIYNILIIKQTLSNKNNNTIDHRLPDLASSASSGISLSAICWLASLVYLCRSTLFLRNTKLLVTFTSPSRSVLSRYECTFFWIHEKVGRRRHSRIRPSHSSLPDLIKSSVVFDCCLSRSRSAPSVVGIGGVVLATHGEMTANENKIKQIPRFVLLTILIVCAPP